MIELSVKVGITSRGCLGIWRTSFLVTGFSINTRCVSFGNVDSASRSASSAILLAVRTKVVRFGIECASDGWMLAIRFRARRSVCNLGERGKFPSTWISLSVKSMASSGYGNPIEVSNWVEIMEERDLRQQHPGSQWRVSYVLHTQIFDINSARLKV